MALSTLHLRQEDALISAFLVIEEIEGTKHVTVQESETHRVLGKLSYKSLDEHSLIIISLSNHTDRDSVFFEASGVEKVHGVGTALIAHMQSEEKCIFVMALDSAKEFYKKNGFIEQSFEESELGVSTLAYIPKSLIAREM